MEAPIGLLLEALQELQVAPKDVLEVAPCELHLRAP